MKLPVMAGAGAPGAYDSGRKVHKLHLQSPDRYTERINIEVKVKGSHDMQVTVETTEGLERRMRVEIPEERIKGKVDGRLRELARNVRIPGFRPGRVPIKVVARRYGQQVRDEVVGEIVQESFVNALTQEKLHPAATPRIAPLESEVGAGVSYTATFDVLPDVTLPQFESMEIARPMAVVVDEDVDRMLETLRAQRRTWKTVERAATPSDRVVVDIEGIVDGEPLEEASAAQLPVQLDAKHMVDGFEDALVGAQAGEDKTLDLMFPQHYLERLAGKPVTFNVKVHRVEEPELPDLDDAFAKNIGVGDGGVEALRGEVRANMERELADGLSTALRQRVMDALLAGSEIIVPESMVREETARAMKRRREELERSGIDPERAEPEPAAFEEPARRRISLGLIVAEIIKEHRIDLDQGRVRSRVETIASTYQDPARVIDWYYSERERLSNIESLVLEDQVVEWIVERALVTDEEASFDRILNPGQTSPVVA